MTLAYYNEIDPFAAQWLRNLIHAGHIAKGDVDERDIREVKPAELAGHTQCHFFAGIGGWSLALRIAGWPDDRPVWTGSCPCQPFSAAGKGKAADDERHLWPAWLPLIAERSPPVVFGEQVEAAIGWGWLDAVFADLEEQGYSVGASVLPACGVGAPHIRQRTWFVANATNSGHQSVSGQRRVSTKEIRDLRVSKLSADGEASLVGNATVDGSRSLDGQSSAGGKPQESAGGSSLSRRMVNAAGKQVGLPRRPWIDGGTDWLPCRDGKARPVEPGTFPLAHGIPGRVGRLRAYGNAIVPQVAAEFIGAYLE